MLRNIFSDQFIKYMFVGGAATLVDLSIFQSLISFCNINCNYAYLSGFLVSVFINFVLCYRLVFINEKVNFFHALIKHYLASSTGMILNFVLFQFWISFIFQTPLFAKISASTITFACNFLMFKWFSFYTKNNI
ncbi:GtrA family protein [Candidatus Dependentiae bacterium]|nr:GtrA family protein [Candidatus Dependentiae bacterium]